jgi:hypothetical protein
MTSVLIRDDYQWADSQFKERFGTNKGPPQGFVDPVGLL